MKIAFDIDGVLTDFEWFLTIYGKKYFQKHLGNQINMTNASSSISKRFGLPEYWEKSFILATYFGMPESILLGRMLQRHYALCGTRVIKYI